MSEHKNLVVGLSPIMYRNIERQAIDLDCSMAEVVCNMLLDQMTFNLPEVREILQEMLPSLAATGEMSFEEVEQAYMSQADKENQSIRDIADEMGIDFNEARAVIRGEGEYWYVEGEIHANAGKYPVGVYQPDN